MAAPEVEFVVVGAGLLGLATGRSLSRRGRDVLVVERAQVGHRRSGSYGASRIFRYGYADPMYVRMARRAGDLWRELETETATTLLDVTGQYSFGAGLDGLFDAMAAAGAPVERMDAAAVAAREPGIAVAGDAVYEPASGVLHADACLAALRSGISADIREATIVTRIVDDGDAVAIEAADGWSVRASVAIVCPGPWSNTFLRAIAPNSPARTFTTQEHVGYFRHRSGSLPRVPIFIAHDTPAAYGLPTAARDSYKLALHHAGAVVDPDLVDLAPSSEAMLTLQSLAHEWLPDFDPVPDAVETCFYDNTADEHFIVDRVGRVVIGAGTSGHGFKFGPLLGDVLADLACGDEPAAPLDAFRLDRPALR